MLNLSCISCLTASEFGGIKEFKHIERHETVFGKYKEENSALYNLSSIMMSNLPFNLINFLSDDDLDAFVNYLMIQLNNRGKKKYYINTDESIELPFFIGNFSLVSLVTDDRPFLYDSVWSYFQDIGVNSIYIVHPIINVKRNSKGLVTDIQETSFGSENESFILLFLDNMEEGKVKEIRDELDDIYQNTVYAVDDFVLMQNLMQKLASEYRETIPEMSQFIYWLVQENFIFQGTRVLNINTDTKEFTHDDKGILKLHKKGINIGHIADSILEGKVNTVDGFPVVVDKSLKKSKIKERSYLDRIIFYERRGNTLRVVFLLGLFSNKGREVPPHEISILKNRVKDTLDHFNFVSGSHDFKWIREILDNFPKTELFNSDFKKLTQTLELVLTMHGSNQIRICYRDFRPLNNMFFFIAIPGDKFSVELVRELGDFLSGYFDGIMLDKNIRRDEHQRYFLHYHLYVNDTKVLDNVDEAFLKRSIVSMMKEWESYLYDILRERLGGGECDEVYAKYSGLFNESYKARNKPIDAYHDIENIRKTKDVYSDIYSDNGVVIIKIYSGRRFLLTELMPAINNTGLKVYEEDIYEFDIDGEKKFINAVILADIDDGKLFASDYKKLIPDLMVAVLSGKVENDRLNTLNITQSMTYRQVDILRAVRGFLKQIDGSFTIKTLNDSLINNGHIAKKLVELFEEKLDPARDHRDIKSINEDLNSMIEAVVSVNEDKALRYYGKAINGIVRTNAYMVPQKDYISFKLKSSELDIIVDPKPLFEIFVHSADMNGIHLRGGKVARGGLRFSDRPDDFRTEVLGLVKTQMVKNALIVPVGSKGGFIVKNRFQDREQDKLHIIEQYRNFIRGLLDITDNLKGKEVIHPENVVIYDENDPYLVVAADKGTATFSDIANAVSVDEYKFWLGDAFASGGSTGYDHKKVGITARGAWESVKRHFRETGKDIQSEDFTVAGIGDMAGDVFGNGMLLSQHIRLLAAFNHIHIFIDPNPDSASTFEERLRLFTTPGTSWKDYKASLISDGGGIFDRSSKKINLSKQMKELFKTDRNFMTGEELVKEILKADVELLWNGGIGTYVRSSKETDLDVGDTANNNVRIDATELKAKVVGEGGNLGFTQRARMEFHSLGGKIYTDAVDNSGGVDMSDHEVNIKIMMNALVHSGDIKSVDERNELIADLTDEVTDLILLDNYYQSMAVSMGLMCFEKRAVTFREAAKFLREKGLLDFRIENIHFTNADNQLTAPEMAVLLAYFKIYAYREVEGRLDLKDKLISREYEEYFPPSFLKRFGDKVYDHQLMHEIAATAVVNRVINQLGPGFAYEVFKGTGQSFSRLAHNYLVAEDILQLRDIRKDIFKLDNKAESRAQYAALMQLEKTVKVAVEWLGDERRAELLNKKINTLVDIVKIIPENLPKDISDYMDYLKDYYIKSGFNSELAEKICSVRLAKPAFDIFEIHIKTGLPIKEVICRYFEIGKTFEVNKLTRYMKKVKLRNEWERENRESLMLRAKRLQKKLTVTYCNSEETWMKKLVATEERFFNNYSKFLASVDAGEIDSLVPYNVIMDSFAGLVQKYEEV